MNKPKIRFNSTNNGWRRCKVGELCDLLTGFPFPGDTIVTEGETLLMRGINITEGYIRHSDDIDRYYSESATGLDKYRLAVGDLVISMDGSKVGKNSALVTGKEKDSLLVQRVARLRNEDKNLIHLIQIAVGSLKFIKYVEEIKTSSAIPHISPADIKNFTISLPEDIAERRELASYFTHLDSLITYSTSRLASLKQMKAASLQAMFPQEGETVPKIRFKGFEGEWESPAIEDVFDIRNGYTPSKAVKEFWEGGTIPWFRMEDIRENGGILKDAIQHITPLGVKGTGLFKKNSIILATTATIGEHAMLIVDSLANQRFTNFTIRKSLSTKYIARFVYYSFFGIDEWSKKNVNSGGLLSVNMPLLLKQPFLTPKVAEQQAIASYFTTLDKQITLLSQRLEKLKQIKSACLDKMFV